jgi:hypothetical protein
VATEVQSAGLLVGPAVPLTGLACGLLTLDELGELDEQAVVSAMVATTERAAALMRRRDRGIMTAP